MSNVQVSNEAIVPNAKRLLAAGFMAILAAGIGFGVRGGILANWGAEFGFTGAELGDIGGAGLTGFCFGIIIGGVIVDKIGYGKLVVTAFVLHVLSAFVTFAASPEQSKMVVYNFLYWGTFIFALANGTLEAVANPLVATLFPNNRTHFLNILHASWPAGLVLGGAIGWFLGEKFGWHWKTQLGLFLIPTVIYGLMFLGQHMPKSEASQKGLKLGEMFQEVGMLGGVVACALIALFVKNAFGPMLAFFTGVSFFSGSSFWWVALAVGGALWAAVGAITRGSVGHWLLFALFIAHALIGAVELGTDGWVQNITGNILTPAEGKILFVFTSAIMFTLRFCADFIEKKMGLSPIGILLTCAVLAVLGLQLTSRIETFAGAMLALAVYAVGKTFFWPTMLAVAGDRFPRTGAIAMSIMGGIGMMSAGMLGFPGLGYAKDRFTSEALATADAATYAEYKVAEPKAWLVFKPVSAVDGKKLGAVQERLKDARTVLATGKAEPLNAEALAKLPENKRKAEQEKHQTLTEIAAKLTAAGALKPGGNPDPKAAYAALSPAEKTVHESSIQGDRRTLVADSAIPATMAVIYLLLFIYFRAIGGYKAVHIVPVAEQQAAEAKQVT